MKTISFMAGATALLIVITVIDCGASPSGKKLHGKRETKLPAQDVSATLVARGHVLFLANCAACHGADAQGDDGPNLHHKNLPESAIAAAVTNGFQGEMPAFNKLKAPGKQALVAYVQSLQK